MSPVKVGTEDRKKLYAAGAFGVFALGYLAYTLSGSFGGDSTPAPVATTATAPATPVSGRAAGPAAASARVPTSRLDPTLHPEGMLLAEAFAYAGNGRNIFQAGAPAFEAAASIPKPIASARYQPATPVYTGPPPPPPIELRFFGTATRADGSRQAFLLHGDDVFVAKSGDIVSRRYRIGAITPSNVEITDLTNSNTQRLPMSSQ